MQYVAIKLIEQEGKTLYSVNAIPLKNKNKSIVQKIPHPMGTDTIIYNTIEEAKEAIIRAGFSYILPDGKKIKQEIKPKKNKEDKSDIEKIIYNTIKSKINSGNANVSAAAILAISEFPTEETFSILFEKIGEENELIRKNAILGISKYESLLQNEIIKALNSENWVTRNSSITCIQSAITNEKIDPAVFTEPLIKCCSDTNPIVQASALTTIGMIYKELKKK